MSNNSVVQKLESLGMALPAPLQLPPDIVPKFPFVRVIGERVLVSGHGPINADGSLATHLFGKVGRDLELEQAQEAAHLTGLAILSSLQDALQPSLAPLSSPAARGMMCMHPSDCRASSTSAHM